MPLDQFSLAGRRALITGSTAGIGFALAEGMAAAGASIVLNGRDVSRTRAAAASLRSKGYEIAEMAFDVTDASAANAAIERIEAETGAIDILVNNAGIQRRMSLEQLPEETWAELMRTNLDGVFYVAKAVARHMIPRRRGAMINICSITSELGRPGIAPYMASKGAVKMLTKGMAIDWAPHGIRVNGVGPGYFATELNKTLVADEKFSGWLIDRTPLGRWGRVEELVGAAVFLSSDAASFVTGHILYVDGGVTARL